MEITKAEENIISAHLIDMVIYARRANVLLCGYFERLLQELKTKVSDSTPPINEIILPAREWDAPGHRDLSINRCPRHISQSSLQFLFLAWKQGSPTPGKKNDCTRQQWILETEFPSEDVKVIPGPSTSTGRGGGSGDPSTSTSTTQATENSKCSSGKLLMMTVKTTVKEGVASRDKIVFSEQTDEEEEEGRDRQVVCVTREAGKNITSLDKKVDELMLMVTKLMEAKSKKEEEEGYEPPTKRACTGLLVNPLSKESSSAENASTVRPWEDTSQFKEGWIKLIEQFQSNYVKKDWITRDKRVWLRYIPNAASPQHSRFQCSICSNYAESHGLDGQNVPEMALKNGTFVESRDGMRRRLTGHSAKQFHQDALTELKQRFFSNLKACMQIRVQAERKSSSTTARVFRTVYTGAMMNLPLESHSTLIKLQQANGLDMGKHHYERRSATRILKVIAEDMKKTLVKTLTEEDVPFSIMVDTTTDLSVINYLSIYVRAFLKKNNRVKTYLFDLLEVRNEKAEALKDLIMTSFEKAGLRDVMKERLVGFASDGAAVMMGKNNGLGVRLNAVTDNNLFIHHCSAHKLQLAILHAFDDPSLTVLRAGLENTVNTLYSFYNRNAVKRKSSLKATAEALQQTLYELNYIHKIRWVASELQALNQIRKNLYIITTNLESIRVDADFARDAETKEIAKSLSSKLENTKFIGMLLFVTDVLDVLTKYSKRLQDNTGSIIDVDVLKHDLLKTLGSLKNDDGPSLTSFLNKARCYKTVDRLAKCKAADLDDKRFAFSPDNASEAIFFHPDSGDTRRELFKPLSRIRGPIVDAVIQEITRYFPDDSLSMFEVLLPKNFPALSEEDELYGYSNRIQELAHRFLPKCDVLDVQNEFFYLLTSLFNDHTAEYCAYSHENPLVFWEYFLKKETVQWGFQIRKLVEIVLCVPISTAEVERGFSILSHIRYDRRSSLLPTTLRDILFIRVNGPPPSHFKVEPYVKSWYKQGGKQSGSGGVDNVDDGDVDDTIF